MFGPLTPFVIVVAFFGWLIGLFEEGGKRRGR